MNLPGAGAVATKPKLEVVMLEKETALSSASMDLLFELGLRIMRQFPFKSAKPKDGVDVLTSPKVKN